MATALKPQYTAEDLLTMPDGDNYELVDGKLVERKTGWYSSWVGGRLYLFLSTFCDANRLGLVAPADASYQCFPDSPNKVRKPDVAFIQTKRLPAPIDSEGHCPVAPDLAVEVISPNDGYSEIERKVAEYLAAGVQLIWVIDPPTKTVRIQRPDGSISHLDETDILDGEHVVPGFRCPVADLFRLPIDETASVQL